MAFNDFNACDYGILIVHKINFAPFKFMLYLYTRLEFAPAKTRGVVIIVKTWQILK